MQEVGGSIPPGSTNDLRAITEDAVAKDVANFLWLRLSRIRASGVQSPARRALRGHAGAAGTCALRPAAEGHDGEAEAARSLERAEPWSPNPVRKILSAVVVEPRLPAVTPAVGERQGVPAVIVP